MRRKIVQTDRAPKAIGPYEQAIKVDGFVFTAGKETSRHRPVRCWRISRESWRPRARRWTGS